MKLYLDTADNTKTTVGLNEKRWSFPMRKPRSQQLLGLIDEILKKKKISLDQIKEIEVNLGPGSFTGLRVGISVANTLGWVLKIPINGQKADQLVEPKYE